MGLDMYLHGEKYLGPDFSASPPAIRHFEDDYRLEIKTLRLGYWRKHPNLHGYIVNTFADGIDECQRIDLRDADIERIIEAVACDDLPHTEGFFFGVSDGSEKEETLRILRAALAWLRGEPDPGNSRSIYYQASW
ncbi:MAG: hypothetical protein IT183_03095 [Acidobacteria bacterium]|nr:hypothetical protein [Acidobacteriota bacterium]